MSLTEASVVDQMQRVAHGVVGRGRQRDTALLVRKTNMTIAYLYLDIRCCLHELIRLVEGRTRSNMHLDA
jgi:hypothetical protein